MNPLNEQVCFLTPRWPAFAMSWIAERLRAHTEFALFPALALGHTAGRLRLGPLKLNPVIGYKTGPQFRRAGVSPNKYTVFRPLRQLYF